MISIFKVDQLEKGLLCLKQQSLKFGFKCTKLISLKGVFYLCKIKSDSQTNIAEKGSGWSVRKLVVRNSSRPKFCDVRSNHFGLTQFCKNIFSAYYFGRTFFGRPHLPPKKRVYIMFQKATNFVLVIFQQFLDLNFNQNYNAKKSCVLMLKKIFGT